MKELFFIDTLFKEDNSKLIFRIDKKNILVGIVFIFFGIMSYLEITYFINIILSLCFITYGMLNIILVLKDNGTTIDFDKGLITVDGFIVKKDISFHEIENILLEKIRGSFFLKVKTSKSKKIIIAYFRTSNSESKAYLILDKLISKGLPVIDKTLPIIKIESEINNKLQFLSENILKLKSSFKNAPKDIMIFVIFLFLFALFIAIVLPTYDPNKSPLFLHIPLITGPFILAFMVFVLGYKDVLSEWIIEKNKNELIIKKYLFKKISTKSIVIKKDDILKIVPRRHLYRDNDYYKGFTIHIVTPQKSFKLGACLGAYEVMLLYRFLDGHTDRTIFNFETKAF